MTSDAVDLGLLIDVVKVGLNRYEAVPVSGLKREYNSRCRVGCEVRELNRRMLEVACGVVDGRVWYSRDYKRIWGVVRR